MLKAAEFGYVGVVKTLINNKHIDVNSRDDVSSYIHVCHHICMYSNNLRTIRFNDADNSALIVLLHTINQQKLC